MILRSQRLLLVVLLGLALYVGPELLDAALAPVPDVGLGEALGSGMLTLPAALAWGVLLTGLTAGAGALLALAANRRAPAGTPGDAPFLPLAPAPRRGRRSPLAAAIAGRAPPHP